MDSEGPGKPGAQGHQPADSGQEQAPDQPQLPAGVGAVAAAEALAAAAVALGAEEHHGSGEEEEGEEGDWLDGTDDDDQGAEEEWDEEDEEWDDEWDEESEVESQFSDEFDPEESQDLEHRAAETEGEHMCPGWVAHAVPTVAHHFQSADALAVRRLPPGSRGSDCVLATTFDAHGVAAWLLPAAGNVQCQGISQPPAVRLGGFQGLRDIYSIALSPDCRYIATGGEGGLLALYSLDPSAPDRPDVPLGNLSLTGVNYFYSPLMLPGLKLERGQHPQPRELCATEVQVLQQQALHHAVLQAEQQQPPQQAQQVPPRQQQVSTGGGLPPRGGAAPGAEVGGLQASLLQSMDTRLQWEFMERQQHLGQLTPVEQLQEAAQVAMAATAGQASRGLGALPAGTLPSQLHPVVLHEGEGGGQGERPVHVGGQVAEASRQANDFLNATMAQDLLSLGAQQQQPGAGASGSPGGLGDSPAATAGRVAAATDPAAATDSKGKRRVSKAAEGCSQQQWEEAQEPHAAVMLRGLFALGLGIEEAKQVPYAQDGMCNGVRFGAVAGKQRLLAAEQNRFVYVFDLPQPGASSSGGGGGDLRAEQLLCASLGEPSPHWRMLPVNFFPTTQHALGARLTHQHPPLSFANKPAALLVHSIRAAAEAARASPVARLRPAAPFVTAAIGPLPAPCNLATASPDGRWIAVVGDAQSVFFVDQQAGFSWRALPFDLAGSRALVEQGLDTGDLLVCSPNTFGLGAQYAAWNTSSTLLALTSDALHAAFVFEPVSGSMVMRVEAHMRPCLCVGFAPWDDRLLVYAEDSTSVHLRRVPAALPTTSSGSSSDEAGGRCVEHSARDGGQPSTQLLRLPLVPSIRAAGKQSCRSQQPYVFLWPVLQRRQAERRLLVAAAPSLLWNAADVGGRRRRVTGMDSTADGELMVTTRQGALLRYISSGGWRQDQHGTWPPAFRAAVKTLLLCVQRQHQQAMEWSSSSSGSSGISAGLWALPAVLVLHIIEMAAGRRTDWLPVPQAQDAGRGAVPGHREQHRGVQQQFRSPFSQCEFRI